MADTALGNIRSLVIIPAYNESATIEFVINDIRNKVPGADLCVINDGSIDNTKDKANRLGAIVISHPFNMGIGSAVQTGFKYALNHNYDIAIQIDGDGQHDPIFISRMIELICRGQANVVSGSRFLEKDGYQSSFARRLGIGFFQIVNRILTGQRITDSTSGFRAFDRRAIELLAFNYPEDYPEPEVLVILKKARLKVMEIPVKMRARQGGQSSIRGYKSMHYMIKVFLALLMQSAKREKK